MRFKIAFRNTFRNKRRTLINVLMIAGGVSAIITYEGFAQHLMVSLREETIKSQTGHLQIASPKYWAKTARSPKETLLDDAPRLIKELKRYKHVKYASGRIAFFGLVSSGETSVSMRALTYDPAVEGDTSKKYRMVGGHSFSQPKAFQVVLGSGLATRARVKVKDRVTVLAQTYEGVVNALDMEVVGMFTTGMAEFDDNSLLIPLAQAQKLLDTDRVEQVIIGLDDTKNTDAVMAEIQARLYQFGEVRPWYTIAKLYNQVVAFNSVQMHMVEIIILSLILLGILNTIGMSIFERTGEIGTIAALGESQRTIRLQFVLEGVMLGLIGSVTGAVLGWLEILFVNSLGIPIVMPGSSMSFPMHIVVYGPAFRDAIILAVLTAGFAAFVPAVRASRMNIADALRRNV